MAADNTDRLGTYFILRVRRTFKQTKRSFILAAKKKDFYPIENYKNIDENAYRIRVPSSIRSRRHGQLR